MQPRTCKLLRTLLVCSRSTFRITSPYDFAGAGTRLNGGIRIEAFLKTLRMYVAQVTKK